MITYSKLWLVALVSLSFSCSSIRYINPKEPSEVSKINKAVHEKTVHVTVRDRREFDGSQLQVNGDSVSFFCSASNDIQGFSVVDIYEIRYTNRAMGAMYGFLGVAIPVGLIGILATSGDSGNDSFSIRPSATDVVRSTLLYGSFGAVIGASIGSKVRYRLLSDEYSRKAKSQQ